MRELKTLLVVLVFVGITYWGVEPFAHSVMHPHVSPANYDFSAGDKEWGNIVVANAEKTKPSDDPAIEKRRQNSIASAKKRASDYELFWNEINKIDLSKGDPAKGAELFAASCTACHSLEVASLPNPMGDANASSEAFGIAPPDLSTAGYIYEPKFLAAIIDNPVYAMKVDHKFDAKYSGEGAIFPMTAFVATGDNKNQEIADIVAYLRSVAPKTMENRAVFEQACDRCHDMRYAKIQTQGNKNSVSQYLGMTPPDLSQMIRSRSVNYLHEFMNDPQKHIPSTTMPRVGLNEKSQEQIVAFMQATGDSKKEEREKTSVYVMIYFLILSVFAYLFKQKVWKNLH